MPPIVRRVSQFPLAKDSPEILLAQHPNSHYQSQRQFAGETFKNQDSMPPLPVPELEASAAKYLKSIEPYTKSAEELQQHQKLVADFLATQGPVLHARLNEFAADKRNWLSHFWDNYAYLQYNDPVVPYVSYFYAHNDTALFKDSQLAKATAIIDTVVKFIEAVKDESLPAEMVKDAPFCMQSFRLMFNNSRVPETKGQDGNVFYSLYENDFVVVAKDGAFYKVATHRDGKPVPPHVIYQQLLLISASAKTGNVGYLTTLPRDEWYDVYQQLVSSPVNARSIEDIHRSSFILTLDQDLPVTLEERSRYAWHGNGYNRWFDKPCQFFVAKNGVSGFIAEHSKMDGTPTLFLNDYVCRQMSKLDSSYIESLSGAVPQGSAEQLRFLVTPAVSQAISTAKSKFENQIGIHDLSVWHYNRYGKNVIKTFGMSPDAYLQQIIQLAWFKYQGVQWPTYEAASTRRFFKGRTEAGRSVSTESRNFVTKFTSLTATNAEKAEALYASAKAHSKYLVEAANGQGCDRHFFGLKQMLQAGEEPHPLLTNPLFNYSSTWLISTSQLSSEYFNGYGWSEVNDNGVGLAYMLNKDWLHINIVTKPELSGLDTKKIQYYLSEAADEMFTVLSQFKKERESKL